MLGPEFFDNPYPTYSQLRAAPLHWVDGFLGGTWLMTRYADVVQGLRDERLSSQRVDLFLGQFPEEVRPQFGAFERTFKTQLIFHDPPEHTRMRQALNIAFTHSAVQAWRPRVERLVEDLLAAALRSGSMEFIADFANPLPALVICEMLGVPSEEAPQFVRWSDELAAFIGDLQPSLESALTAQEARCSISSRIGELVEERKRHPGADVISQVLGAAAEGGSLSDEELVEQCTLLLVAGHETTRNLLGNGLLALLQNPQQMQLLPQMNSAQLQVAVRELLRYDSPVQFISRVVKEDFELYGEKIREGQNLTFLLASANRDPERFSDPDRLDLCRNEGGNLGFGYGPHVCIGATVAYLEGEIAFKALVEGFEELTLVDETPRWGVNPGFRGLCALPLTVRRAKSQVEAAVP